MAKLLVEYQIPDGDVCNDGRIRCKLNTQGTVCCELFGVLLSEREEKGGRYTCVKCEQCMKAMMPDDAENGVENGEF